MYNPFSTCKGEGLHCARGIFDEMSSSNYKQILDVDSVEERPCLESCSDQQSSVTATTSAYPAELTFPFSKEACLLVIKFFEKCKVSASDTNDEFNINYPSICPSLNDPTLRQSFRDNFVRMGLETSLLDTNEPQLEWERQDVVRTFCDDNLATNWEGILAEAPQSFLEDLHKYASENLIKLQLFISTPFATEYKRYIETPRISFIANIGGLMGLCMGFSFVSLAEIIYYLGQLVCSRVRKPESLPGSPTKGSKSWMIG